MMMAGHQIRGIIAVCVILAMIPLVFFMTEMPRKVKVPILSTSYPRTLVVEVAGSDRASGIYFLGPETSTRQLFSLIGLTETYGTDEIKIKNGLRMRLTPHGHVAIEQMEAAKRLALGLPLDINLADVHELALIPGVGDLLASQIVEYRERNGRFKNIDQLMEMRGIKEKKLSRLRQYLYVDESDL